MKYSNKAGLPPGSLVHIGNVKNGPVKISAFSYNEQNYTEFAPIDLLSIKNHIDEVIWLNIDGLNDIPLIEKIGEVFDLHHLLLEDILNTGHMPKTEEFDDYIFVTIRMLDYDDNSLEILNEQISFVLGSNYVITFQENEGDVLDPIRERIRSAKGKVRQRKADYLLYILLDAIVDKYFYILEKLGDQLEDLEEEVIINPSESFLQEILDLKKQLTVVRRAIYPIRDLLNTLTKSEGHIIGKKTARYYKDIQDHALQIIDTIETHRDTISSLMEIYLSTLSHKMNSVIKLLTIISTIFIPLTFIVGVYGMNFDNLPELRWHYGYYMVLGVMGLISVAMLYYFKRKEWL